MVCASGFCRADGTCGPASDVDAGGDAAPDALTGLCTPNADGMIVREVNSNSCPQAHAIAQDGSNWSSDYISNVGFGAEYRCSN